MKNIKSDFPMLATVINGNPLVYLDSAATAQKPKVVLDALYHFYAHEYATIGRGLYPLAESATQRYEDARATCAHFINATPDTIIFTQGATHGMNLLAHAWGMSHLNAGDEIILAEWEHHSTLLPWQHVAAVKGAAVRYIPVLPNGTLDYSAYEKLLNKKTKAVIVSHVSNVFGTQIPVQQLCEGAHRVGARFFLDAAQSAPHGLVDLKKLLVDALVFSGHKMGGPTGIGVLYATAALQEEMDAYQKGGGMVFQASFEKSSWRKGPHKFEAGTPPFAQAIGLAAAIEYVNKNIDFKELRAHEAQLCAQLIQGLSLIAPAKIYGPREQLEKEGHLVSFALQGVPAHDAAGLLGARGICVRAGNLCAQPLAAKLSIDGLIRASFYVYNTSEDVEGLLAGIEMVLQTFGE
jgi:cysteine desulfurase/selenocysteine lyase